MSARKLRHYFEGHRIIVVTNQPLHDLFHNREASDRISKWASELSEYVVGFERWIAIKSQVLADFITDWTSPTFKQEAPIEPWVIYCDGAWCNDGVGISTIIESPSGTKLWYAARLEFSDPNHRIWGTSAWPQENESSGTPKLCRQIWFKGHHRPHWKRIRG